MFPILLSSSSNPQKTENPLEQNWNSAKDILSHRQDYSRQYSFLFDSCSKPGLDQNNGKYCDQYGWEQGGTRQTEQHYHPHPPSSPQWVLLFQGVAPQHTKRTLASSSHSPPPIRTSSQLVPGWPQQGTHSLLPALIAIEAAVPSTGMQQ